MAFNSTLSSSRISSVMVTLITGGTSQIGLALAHLLQQSGESTPVFATGDPGKVPEGYEWVKFDRMREETFERVFDSRKWTLKKAEGQPRHVNGKTQLQAIPEGVLSSEGAQRDRKGGLDDKKVGTVYLLPPLGLLDPMPVMRPFINLAMTKGVKRFVLLSSSRVEKGGNGAGKVHAYLEELGVEFLVLRPTTFIENIFNLHSRTIKDQNAILSAVPNGKVPFVSVEDVAQVACDYITGASTFSGKDVYVVGPEALTHDELALTISTFINKPIEHWAISAEAQLARYRTYKVPEAYGRWMVDQEVGMDGDCEERLLEMGLRSDSSWSASLGEHGKKCHGGGRGLAKNVYVGRRKVADVLEARRGFWGRVA